MGTTKTDIRGSARGNGKAAAPVAARDLRGNGKAKKPRALDITVEAPAAPKEEESRTTGPETDSVAAAELDRALAGVKLALSDEERAELAAHVEHLGLQAERAYLLHILKPDVIGEVKAKDAASIVKTLAEIRTGGASEDALAPWERILAKCLTAAGRGEDEA